MEVVSSFIISNMSLWVMLKMMLVVLEAILYFIPRIKNYVCVVYAHWSSPKTREIKNFRGGWQRAIGKPSSTLVIKALKACEFRNH